MISKILFNDSNDTRKKFKIEFYSSYHSLKIFGTCYISMNHVSTLRPEENSTISSAWMFFKPCTRAIPSPMLNTLPVSSKSALGAAPNRRSSNMVETTVVLFGVPTWILRLATDTAGKAAPVSYNSSECIIKDYHSILLTENYLYQYL